MRKQIKLLPPDSLLLLTVLGLVVAGVWFVFDASYAKAADLKIMNNDPWYLVKRQIPFAILGLSLMLGVMRAPFSMLKKSAPYIMAVAFAGLVIVLVPGIGHKAHGAQSWFKIGSLQLQPSEFAKIAILLYLANALYPLKVFSKKSDDSPWMVPVVVCAAVIGIIVLEKDLGSAALLFCVCFTVFFAAGAKKRVLFLIGMLGVVTALGAVTQVSHCQARVRAFMDPWKYRYNEGYQTVHSLQGLGTGGLWGVGLCEGREKFYMPAASTDYIYTTVGEEAGFLRGLILLGAFAFFTYRGLHIAHRSKSRYGAILAIGVVSLITIQTFINLAVVTSLVPATGLPLPFISYGGSGMVSLLACVGLLLSVSRQLEIEPDRRELDEGSSSRRRNRRPHISGGKRRTSSARDYARR